LDWAFGLILVGPNVVLVGCAVVVSDCDELTFNEPPTFYSRQTYKFLGKMEFAKKEVYWDWEEVLIAVLLCVWFFMYTSQLCMAVCGAKYRVGAGCYDYISILMCSSRLTL
jgi:hypothetical protein